MLNGRVIGDKLIIVVDVDGTLTIDRDTYIIYPQVIDVVKKLRSKGHVVILASGNSIPVLAGLARYLGANMSCIAENGCAIFHEGYVEYIPNECRDLEAIEDIIANKLKDHLKPSWQNKYRLCDKSFNKISNKPWRELLGDVRYILSSNSYVDFIATSTQYAIHITHRSCNKSIAIERLLNKFYNTSWDKVIAVGDSVTDLEMIMKARIGCAVANADPELISIAKCIATKPSGKGFVEVIEKLVL